MSYKLLTGPELDVRLNKAIKTTDQVKLAVAFWGRGASDRLNLKRGAKIICNLTSGGTNPDEIRIIRDKKIEVRQHNNLHAKIGCVGEEMSFVGSSNMSANGLGDEGDATKGSEESNIVFSNLEKSIEKRFDSLWKSSKKITNKCLERAEEAWRTRRQANYKADPSKLKAMSFRNMLLNDLDQIKDYNSYVVVFINDVWTKEDDRIYESAKVHAKEKYGSDFDVYWDWSELPEDAYLINYCKPPQGRLSYEGIWRRHPDSPDFKEKGDWFQAARLVKEIPGITLGEEDKADLKKAVALCIKGRKACEAGTYCFPVSDLVDYLGKN